MIRRWGSKSLLHDDVGAFAILYAVLVLVLVGVVALVFDLAMVRQDRRAQRLASDAAAVAGAARLGETISPDPQAACVLAWRYARVDLGVTKQNDKASNCATVFANPTQPKYVPCPPTASTATGSFTVGTTTFTVSTTWPVFDTDPLMDPDIRPAVSTLTQPVVGSDSLPCKRIGVRIRHSQPFVFATIWGYTGTVVDNHSVAINTINGDTGDVAAPLVILDPRSCNALTAEGGGGVDIKINLSVTPPIPGLIAINSDGLGGDIQCNGGLNGGTNVVNSNAMSGNGTLIWAEGSAAAGPGQILMYAPFPPSGDAFDLNQITCDSSFFPKGALCPRPDGLPSQISRTFMDQRYNCSILGSCKTTPDTHDGIAEVNAFVNTAVASKTGFDTIVSGADCKSKNPLAFYPGNVLVDCPSGFTVTNHVAFPGNADPTTGTPTPGNDRGIVVFTGDVSVSTSSGCLMFNVSRADADPSSGTACVTPSVAPVSQDGPIVFVAGTLGTGSGGAFIAPQTFLYEGACLTDGSSCSLNHGPSLTANLAMQDNTAGTILWSAPLGSSLATPTTCVPAASASTFPTPACFEKLSFWNEYATTNSTPDRLYGQAALDLRGTFFTPTAQFFLRGGANADIKSAQFVTKRLDVNGGTVLTMIPDPGHTNLIPLNGGALIR